MVVSAVVASSSIPAIFHPLEREGRRFVDGGILERVPAARLKEMGADIVVAVDVLALRHPSKKAPGTLGVLLETFDVMDNCRTREYKEKYADVIDFWLEPDLGDISQYSLKEVKFAYQQGYELGKVYAPKISKALRRRTIRESLHTMKKKLR